MKKKKVHMDKYEVAHFCRSYALIFFVLFILKELEKLAGRKLRITAQQAMKIAEKLYTQG